MKKQHLLFILLALLTTFVASAQSELDSTLTSPGGLTVQYPSTYIGEADEAFTLAFLNLENSTFLIIGVGEDALSMVDGEPQNSVEMKDGFVRTLNMFGGLNDDDPIQELQINDRPAFVVPFANDAIGRGYFAAFDLADGTIASAMLFGSSDVEFPEGSAEELVAIIRTVTLDPSLATATEEPAIIETAEVEPAGDIVETEEPNTIPEGAILIDDMPDDLILTGSGLQMNRIDGFGFLPGTDYVENSVGLISNDFVSNIIISDDTLEAEDMDVMVRTLVLLTGLEDFDPETDLKEVDVDGRTITYFEPTASMTDEVDGLGGIYYYFVELVPDGSRIATVQSIYAGGDLEGFSATMLEFVQSIQLTEDEIAQMEAPPSVDCFTQAVSVADETTKTTTVTCPAGCDIDPSTIWGTDIYTNDSSICVAAIHAGVIDSSGGAVAVTQIEGQSAYISTTQNGITSSEYGEWGASFSVAVPETE